LAQAVVADDERDAQDGYMCGGCGGIPAAAEAGTRQQQSIAQHSTALSTVTDGASYGRHASPLGTGQGHVTLVPLLNSCLLTDRPHHASAQIREF